MAPMPPRFVRRLLSAFLPESHRAVVLTDLDDEFAHRSRSGSSQWWYRRQALTSLPGALRIRLRSLFGESSGDLRYAARLLRRPVVPMVVMLTIAAGIASVTAVFSVADAALFRPVPLPDSERILRVYTKNVGESADDGPVSSVNYFDIRDVAADSKTLAAVAPYTSTTFTWRADGGPEQVAAVRVAEPYLSVIGLRPALGRWFDASEFNAGADAVTVITDGFWRRAFGARPDAVGQSIDLDGRRLRIVGVLPKTEFLFPAAAELWVPLVIAPDSYLSNRQSVQLGAIARVKPDQTVETAATEIATIDSRLRAAYPLQSGRRFLSVRPLADTLAAPVRPTLLLLVAAVGALLLIAAANIADLLLSDAGARRHEFAIRCALGAGTGRLTRQVLIETGLLVVIGGAIGLALAPMVTNELIARYPGALPRAAEIGLNWRALGAACLATAIAGALASIPLVRASRRAAIEGDLRQGNRAGGDRGARRLASTLVVCQVALSVMLLSGGVMLLKTFMNVAGANLGFTPANVLVFNVAPSGPRYEAPEVTNQFFAEIFNRTRELPGVSAVGVTQFLPFAPGMWGDSFARVGEPDREPNLPEATVHFISPGLTEALGLRVVAGRNFTEDDQPGRPLAAIVNETLARGSFGGAAVGRRIVWQKAEYEIVGVLSDKRHVSLVEAPRRELYLPWAQQKRGAGWIVVRADDPAALVPVIKERLRAIDPTVPMTRTGLLEARISAFIAPERFRASLAGVLGITAVGLSMLGLYGILTHRVRRQHREIAIRLALGESASRVQSRIVLSSLRLCLFGVAAGVVGSIWSTKLIQQFMSAGLSAGDPRVVAAVSAALVVVGVMAAWFPARRAGRISPLAALREE